MQRIAEFIKTLTGEKRLPKSVRSILEKYGDKNVIGAEIVREPLSKGATAFSDLISGGKFSEIRDKYYDKFYHLYMILILDDYKELLYEKNQSPVLWTTIPKKTDQAESRTIKFDEGIPLAQFVQKHIDRVGLNNYMTYNPTSLNCQNFILNALQANGYNDAMMKSFIYQDLTKLIEETPAFSKWLAKKVTDVASSITNPVEELIYKRGSIVVGIKRSKRGRRVGQF